MKCLRFVAPGQLTNYELDTLRADGVGRFYTMNGERKRVRYTFMWESLNDPDHPTSQADWDRKRHKEDAEE